MMEGILTLDAYTSQDCEKNEKCTVRESPVKNYIAQVGLIVEEKKRSGIYPGIR